MNSKRKGADGEREVAAYLREHGIDAHRGQQYKGGADSPDVVSDLNGWHIEVKRVEHLNIDDALNQSIRDAGENQKPCVFHRRNRTPWKVTMLLDDFMEMVNHGKR